MNKINVNTENPDQSWLQVIVSGKVQGVFYRASTKRVALSLGLVGWVRNLNSGEVEVYAKGPTDKLQQLLDWLWIGPEKAKVTKLDALDSSKIETSILTSFEVRYD